MIGAVGLGVGDRRDRVQGVEVPTALTQEPQRDLPGPFLREARSGSGFLDYVAKRDEFTIHAHIGEPFLSLQRLKPANVPRPYRRRAACPATGRVLVQIALQEDQRFRFAAE